ncbi:unnamed protein product [Hermetia illucens]|uniref:Uncharacterized protein n=1 Tax=Hermetia illucens TaxID=343691 RepID=A0A7R8UTT3_HERIL|nr:unnamed protein product [Hermetia illucens]
MIRLAIYKKIVITLVLVAIAVVHKVDCGPDHSDVVIDEKAPSGDVTRSGGGSEESRQMTEFFAKDDVRKLLITLRTFLMGVRNFAEALGGFVPSNQHMISEKNAAISKYGGIFNTVRIVSNAAQYVAKFLEDLLVREIEDSSDARQTSTSSEVLESTFRVMRSMAAAAINAYNYYSPEIAYTRCVTDYMQRKYPDVLPQVNLSNTVRALSSTYQLASTYFNALLTDRGLRNPLAALSNIQIFDDNSLNNEVLGNVRQLGAWFNRQRLLPSQKQGLSYKDLQKRTSRLPNKRNRDTISYGGPRQLGGLDSTGFNQFTTPSSIFNFDDAVAEQLGMQRPNVTGTSTEEMPTFTRCTQNYSLQVLWRFVQGMILKIGIDPFEYCEQK